MNCPICKTNSLRLRFNLSTFAVGRCPACGVSFNQTYYENEKFRHALFEKEYYEEVQSEAFKSRLENFCEDPSFRVFEKYLIKIEETLKPGKVLDVGCAFGTFLKIAQGRGWTPYGVELSEYSSSLARKTWGFEIFSGDLNSCPFERGAFDLVTFWDVLEHVGDPKENLGKAYDLLKPGGYLLLTTDNENGLIPQIAEAFYTASFGKFKYAARKFFIPYNTCYFSPENMKRLLKSCRFELVFFEGIDYPLEKMNLSHFERTFVLVLYAVGNFLRMNSQFFMIARKR